MIRTQSVSKYYGRSCALRDLSLRIEDREVVGFLGLNGAGKTTTLRILAGLLAPSQGTVEIDGADLLGPDGPKVRQRIGFLPDRPPVYDEMPVRGYVAFAARLRGLQKDVDERVDEVLQQVELTEVAQQTIGSLSHGFRQRVGIAQAIVHRPALVILDEPTSGLDPVQIAHMRGLVRKLGEAHTVLVSSHNLPEIEQTCDRLLVIRDGALVAQGTEAELAARSRRTDTVSVEVRGSEESVRSALKAATAIIETFDLTPLPDDVWRLDVALVQPVESFIRHLVHAGLGVRRVTPHAGEIEELFMELASA